MILIDSLETKYQFENLHDSLDVDFKGVELKSFESRGRSEYRFFNPYIPDLIDNLQRSLIDSYEKV